MQELVVVVQLVVLMLDSLNTVEDLEERILEDFCVFVELRSRFLAHLLKVLATPPRAHGARIIGVEDLVALLQLDTRVLTGHDDSTAGFAGAHLGPGQGFLGCARGVVAVH